MAISVKIVVGAAMAVVVLIVASVTLAITYSVSIDAVRTSGQRLAGSMTDTVGARVSGYMNTTERAVTDFVQTAQYPGYMLLIDDPQPRWWEKWQVLLRTIMIESDWDYSNLAFTPDDGGLVVLGTWWVNTSYVYSYVLDPRSLASTGVNTVVNLENRAKYTFAPYTGTQGSFYPDYLADQRGTAGSSLKALSVGLKSTLCLWNAPTVNTFSIPTGDFVIYDICTFFNQSGTYLGFAAAGRRIIGIGDFLSASVVTPHTTLFVIDTSMQLIASNTGIPSWQFYDVGENGVKDGVNGCVSSGVVAGRTTRIGCRAFASKFPYAPLNSIATSDPTFITTASRDERYGSLAGDKYYYVSLRIPSNFQGYNMNLVLFLPESDVLGDITKGLNIAIGVTVAVFVVAVMISFILLQVLLSPLDEVAERMYRVANLETDDGDVSLDGETDEFTDLKSTQPRLEPLAKSGMTEIRALQVAYETMDSALQSFTRYVPRDVVRELVASGQICEITMRPAMCSMLFVDIANFTSMCERIPAPALSTLVRKYFERNSRVVMGHGGIIDKFIGDCVMAVWGAPIQIDKHELRSAVCARMLVHEAQSDPLKSAFAEMGEALAVRVGVATGEVLAGNMGSAERMSYTVIGDDVNLAARLESLNKQWGTNSLVSETTALECQDWLVMRHVATIAVVGKDQPVAVSEIVGVRPNVDTEVVGGITSDSSENRSLTQTHRDREKEALNDKYLNNGAPKANAGPVSVGKLLRRAMRKAPVAPEDITWATEYSAVVALYEKRDFAKCLQKLNDLCAMPGMKGRAESLSVMRFTRACEEYIRTPPSVDFNGSWRADEK